MELNVWLNSTIEPNPQYDEATELWSVKVIKDGVVRNMRVGHVVSHFLVSTFRLSHFFSPCTIRLTLALLDRSSLPDSVEKLECLLSLPEANSRERSTTRLNTLEVRSGLERRLWSSDVATLVTTSYVHSSPFSKPILFEESFLTSSRFAGCRLLRMRSGRHDCAAILYLRHEFRESLSLSKIVHSSFFGSCLSVFDSDAPLTNRSTEYLDCSRDSTRKEDRRLRMPT